jgi:hypothetical protein
MTSRDPRGYYAILGVPVSATAAEIRSAFRRRAMELHPDRNKAPGATAKFQRLTEAYSVLSDPDAREDYDAGAAEPARGGPKAGTGAGTGTGAGAGAAGAGTEPPKREAPKSRLPEPVVCSCCGKVTAQPRYAVYHEVKSFLLISRRTPVQGVFCSHCAGSKAVRASAVTWLLGWWGLPLGPIYSVHAILTNLFGGKRPPLANARLAASQATYFAATGNAEMARAVGLDALDLVKTVKPDPPPAGLRHRDEALEIRRQVENLLASLNTSGKPVRLKDSWALFKRPFHLQFALALCVVGAGAYALPDHGGPFYRRVMEEAASLASEPLTSAVPVPVVETLVNRRALAPAPYQRPVTAPNGQPWPLQGGYVEGYPRLNTSGLSTVTVDNTRTDDDVFVKLVLLTGPQPRPVRVFYVPAGGSFTVERITEGTYDLRYRNLGNGQLRRSQPFELREVKTVEGTEYSITSLNLYKSLNGGSQMMAMSEGEF